MLYKVTTELKTTWWKKLLRWLRLSKPIEKFDLLFESDCFNVGDILDTSNCKVIIIEKVKQKI